MTAIIMDKSLKKIILCFTVILSVAVFNLFQVAAVDVNKTCSLKLNECLSGLNVHLYRVASIDEVGSYQYTEDFKEAENTTIDLNKLETSEELKNAAMTLKGYAVRKEGVTKTTASSTLTYSNLNTGLYLVVADNLVIDGKTYTYLPYLISLPQGTKYDVSIDFDVIKEKCAKIMNMIDEANTKEELSLIKNKLRKYRESGINKDGEYSESNLVYKVLRRNGTLVALNDKIEEKQREKIFK